jgi:hypothetical protein
MARRRPGQSDALSQGKAARREDRAVGTRGHRKYTARAGGSAAGSGAVARAGEVAGEVEG